MKTTKTWKTLFGCFALLLVCFTQVDAAVTVTGKVLKLPDHHAAVGYPVIMYPDSIEVVTDSEGAYTVTAEKLGELLVVKNDDEHIPCALERISAIVFVERSPGEYHMRPIVLAFTPEKVKPKVWKTSGVVTELRSLGAFDPPCRLASGLVMLELSVLVAVDENGRFKEATDAEIKWSAGKHPIQSDIDKLIDKIKGRLQEIEYTPDTDKFCRPTPTEIIVPVKVKYETEAGWVFVSRLRR